jgi:2-polyprenyl-6-methoxyphenol hydroxylase-like FAD-dependent oxidoreductase
VFERAATPRELGFALALAPNAMAALGALGLADTIAAEAIDARVMEIRRLDGRVRRRISLADIGRGRPDQRTFVALRPALHGALLDAVGHDTIELACEATGVSVRGGSAVLELADGRTVAGDAVIGADGVGSAIRRCLHPGEPPPRPSGFSAVRGVAHEVGHHLGEANAVWYVGDGVEIGVAQASRTAVYWYMSLITRDLDGGARDPRQIVDRVTANYDPAFRAITRATRPDDLRFDELFERDPITSWGDGAVTLLGDAAHPMLPHAGQGANQALEDAITLATLLEHADRKRAPTALLAYEALRRERTAEVQRRSRRTGARLDVSDRHAEHRDRELARQWSERAWIYDYDAEAAAAAVAVGGGP